jgi:hypothetical protein
MPVRDISTSLAKKFAPAPAEIASHRNSPIFGLVIAVIPVHSYRNHAVAFTFRINKPAFNSDMIADVKKCNNTHQHSVSSTCNQAANFSV